MGKTALLSTLGTFKWTFKLKKNELFNYSSWRRHRFGIALRCLEVCARQYKRCVPLSHFRCEHRRLFAHRLVLRTRCTRTPWQQCHNTAAYHRLVWRLHHVLHILQREHRALAWRQRFRRPTLHRQQHVLRTACRCSWLPDY